MNYYEPEPAPVPTVAELDTLNAKCAEAEIRYFHRGDAPSLDAWKAAEAAYKAARLALMAAFDIHPSPL